MVENATTSHGDTPWLSHSCVRSPSARVGTSCSLSSAFFHWPLPSHHALNKNEPQKDTPLRTLATIPRRPCHSSHRTRSKEHVQRPLPPMLDFRRHDIRIAATTGYRTSTISRKMKTGPMSEVSSGGSPELERRFERLKQEVMERVRHIAIILEHPSSSSSVITQTHCMASPQDFYPKESSENHRFFISEAKIELTECPERRFMNYTHMMTHPPEKRPSSLKIEAIHNFSKERGVQG